MDFISHGLWGAAAFGRKNRKDFWWAVFIGMAPDLFSFGLYTAATILGLEGAQGQRFGQNDMNLIPSYVVSLYNVTHSLVIFAFVFGIVWLLRRKPQWLLGAWGLHILVDIPSHSTRFFATPFLWPLSDFKINGISWGNPYIFFPNWILLAIVYGYWFIRIKTKKKKR